MSGGDNRAVWHGLRPPFLPSRQELSLSLSPDLISSDRRSRKVYGTEVPQRIKFVRHPFEAEEMLSICGPKSSRRYLILINLATTVIAIIFLIVGGVSLTQGEWKTHKCPVLDLVFFSSSAMSCGITDGGGHHDMTPSTHAHAQIPFRKIAIRELSSHAAGFWKGLRDIVKARLPPREARHK